jgi:hypothetical protein
MHERNGKKELSIWQHIYNINDPSKLSSLYANDAQFIGAFEKRGLNITLIKS